MSEVRLLSDGRVVAVVEQRGAMLSFTAVDVLVPQDGGYLIDAILDIMFG